MKFLQVAALLAIFLLCLGLVAPAAGSGPGILGIPLPWNFTMAECYLFRNESNLRPFFYLWPESIKGVPFSYCCEYQSGDQPLSPTSFNLSRYGSRNISSPGNPNNIDMHFLVPAPYYELGIIDKNFKVYLMPHFGWTNLPFRLRAPYRPPLYCEATDLYRLYKYRLGQASFQAFIIAVVLIVIILFLASVIRGLRLCIATLDYHGNITPNLRRALLKVQGVELFLDLCHVMLLAFLGTFLIEAMGHSDIREWRSQFMYNSGIVYWLLTFIAVYVGAARHGMDSKTQDKKGKSVDFQGKKVFAQLAAVFVLCTYLSLVEDVTGHRLDAVASLVLGVVLGAATFSVMEYEWLRLLRACCRMKYREPKKCPICEAPMCGICRHEAAQAYAVGAGRTAGGPSARR